MLYSSIPTYGNSFRIDSMQGFSNSYFEVYDGLYGEADHASNGNQSWGNLV